MLRGLGSSSLITVEERNDNIESSSTSSSVITFVEKKDNLYSMLFGVSFAFFSLRLFSNPGVGLRPDGSFDLILALLVWRAHKERLKLEDAERTIEELKARRREDARANEKAVGMFATREQTWFSERKKLCHELRELREKAKHKDQYHSTEILNNKTASVELLSKQRQLEEEMSRALIQAEAANQELDSVSQQKEESILMVHKLSIELMKIRKDLEQKDNVLSAMLRKSKLDTAEKQLLLKEIKLSKAKRKQAEVETERWKAESGTRNERHSPDHKNVSEFITSECLPEGYVQHQLEIEAFAEQMRLKDEKLEACRSRLLSMEMESKRLQSHIEGLEFKLSQLRKDNMKLEWSLKKQMEFPNHQNQISDPALSQDTIWLSMQAKTKPKEVVVDITVQSPSSSSSSNYYLAKDVSWKMDLHALGVSYKVKRLKHQIHMVERLIGKQQQECCSGHDDTDSGEAPALRLKTILTLLNKQVNRYQSLHVKVDELCKRIIKEKNVYRNIGECRTAAAAIMLKDERKSVEQLLGQTFKLQRYIVATGQMLIEIQSKIAYGFVGTTTTSGFDMKRFAENVRALFRQVQRDLDVRISRVIGDLEGTLACDGMTRLYVH